MNVPLENSKINGFDNYSDGTYLIYDELLKGAKKDNVVFSDNENLCITHHFDKDNCYCVIINHSNTEQKIDMKISENYEFVKAYKGNCETVQPFDACVLKFIKK